MRPLMTIKKSRPVNGKPSASFVLYGNTGESMDDWKWFERAGYPTIEAAQKYAAKKGWDTEIEAV